MRAEFLARARLDAPADDAPPLVRADDAPPRTSFFDEGEGADGAAAGVDADGDGGADGDDGAYDDVAFPAPTAAEVCGQKLRRERGKQAAARARHNGAGKSRNFSKQYSAHGKTKHREKIRASEY